MASFDRAPDHVPGVANGISGAMCVRLLPVLQTQRRCVDVSHLARYLSLSNNALGGSIARSFTSLSQLTYV